MPLIKSISGIRGTIGGKVNDNLTPIDIVSFAASYSKWLIDNSSQSKKLKIVLGRDARISGEIVESLVISTLKSSGIDVINLGLSTTPTVEMAVVLEKADGGIILTASHNPKQWNALKLLNSKGEFLSGEDGKKILENVENSNFQFVDVDLLGSSKEDKTYIEKHVDEILKLDLINVNLIKSKKFKIAIDAVNSTGGISIPVLLKKLGIEDIVELNCEPTGHFAHDPEPLEKNLTDIMQLVKSSNSDFGIVVDPDVDRLALISEDGSMFGEEYTLVAVADYILSKKKGATVSNLSSSRALKDLSDKHGVSYYSSAVGEVNVVEKMKEVNAIIGGEGNGGIILPELHYGRDSLVGIALFLSFLAEKDQKVSEIRKGYSDYFMSKTKVELTPEINVDNILKQIESKYANENISTIDGIKIDFENNWVHLRKSNTEPIIRIYTEAKSQIEADNLSEKFNRELLDLAK
jgi:phosphomannomutase